MNPPIGVLDRKEEEETPQRKLAHGHIMKGGIISPNMRRKKTIVGIFRDWLYENLER
jgi:hypothetical protein